MVRQRIRDGNLERFMSVPILSIERPSDGLMQCFQVLVHLFCDVTHDGMHSFRLVVLVFAMLNVFS